jgi:hypothetical protein
MPNFDEVETVSLEEFKQQAGISVALEAALQKLAEQLLTQGEYSERIARDCLLGVTEVPNFERPLIVKVPPSDKTAWEFLPSKVDREGRQIEFAAKSPNAPHFFRELQVPETGDLPPARTPRFIQFVTLQDSGIRDISAMLSANGYEDASPVGTNRQDLLEALEAGTDALLLFVHGSQKRGLLADPYKESTAEQKKPLTVEDLETAIRKHVVPSDLSLEQPLERRLLRFALVVACEQQFTVPAMLERLARDGCLHPQFGAVVMWGSPNVANAVTFAKALLKGMLESPEPIRPFLQSVFAAREKPEACLPMVLIMDPNANPLPNCSEQVVETLLWEAEKPIGQIG